MGSCLILTPVVIAAWPVFSAAVTAAAATLGFTVAREASAAAAHIGESANQRREEQKRGIALEIPNSTVVTDQVGRDQRISVSKEGLTIVFSRDSRGKASLHVHGEGRSPEELRAAGEELSRRVVQQYAYQRLRNELKDKDFLIVEEEMDANQTIRLKVRRWEN